jgi:amino acid permease
MDQMNQAGPGATPSDQLVRKLSEIARGSSAWMKFLGVMLIIDGVMLAITGIGLLICWLPIWLGVILFQAASDAEMASKGAVVKLLDYVQKVNRFFLIQGILALLILVLSLIVVFFFGMAVFWGLLAEMAG